MSEVIDARFRNNFMVEIFECDNAMGAMKVYSAYEAIEKIRQYEQEKEEIQVGDEVITASGKAVVTGVGPVHFEYVYADGSHGFDKVKNIKKTGRHFPEIAEVLRKMKESDNG
jgi:phage terminase small subunit